MFVFYSFKDENSIKFHKFNAGIKRVYVFVMKECKFKEHEVKFFCSEKRRQKSLV